MLCTKDTVRPNFNIDKFETYEDLNPKDWQVPVTMHEDERICSLINKLKERLAKYNPTALEDFWNIVEKRGTRLLEPIPSHHEPETALLHKSPMRDYER